MHARDRALAKPFKRNLGAEFVLPLEIDIDSDALVTFTGETVRAGTMLDAVCAKPRPGMTRTGLKFGLASEFALQRRGALDQGRGHRNAILAGQSY